MKAVLCKAFTEQSCIMAQYRWQCNVSFLVIFYSLIGVNLTHGISTLTDASILQKSKEFEEFCPISFDNSNNSGSLQSCCRECSNKSCGLNCCPDKSRSLLIREHLHSARELYQCIAMQYLPSALKAKDNTYSVVSNCLFDYTDELTRKMCKSTYSEYTFETPLRNFLPAFDINTDSIYKNMFCAKCNNVNANNIRFARAIFSCPFRNITYVRDISTKMRQGNCNILFKPENYLINFWTVKACLKTFDRCNISGQWEVYDRQLEEMCLSYRGTIYQLNLNFRNIHCYLCNGFSRKTIEMNCNSSVFPHLLDTFFVRSGNVHRLSASLPEIKLNFGEVLPCIPNMLYNFSERHHWHLQCPEGMKIYSESFCILPDLGENTAHEEEHFVMETNLLLQPNNDSDTDNQSLYQILMNVSSALDVIRSGLVPRKSKTPHLIRGYIQFKQNATKIKNQSSTVNVGSVSQIYVHIQQFVRRDIEEIINHALVFSNVSNIGGFVWRIYHQSEALVSGKLHHNCDLYLRYPIVRICEYYNRDTRLFFEISKHDLDIIHSLYSANDGYIVRVEREPFCPRVALSKIPFADDVSYCNERALLQKILSDAFILNAVTENDTHLLFCHEDYFQRLLSLHEERGGVKVQEHFTADDQAFLYLTIICLSLSILCLAFTLFVYSLVSVLRTLPGLNNMALTISLLMYQITSLINNITFLDIEWLCILLGVLIHFSLIFSFTWMLVCTFHMMKVFVGIRNRHVCENERKTFAFYVVFTVAVALTAVSSTVVVAEIQSDWQDMGYGGQGCYIKRPVMGIYFIVVPVGLVLMLNFLMFCKVVFTISRLPRLANSRSKERRNFTIFIKLSTITGLTWVFAFLFYFTRLNIFIYFFIIMNGLQGAFIMFSFVINKNVYTLLRGNVEKNNQGDRNPRGQVKIRSKNKEETKF